MINRLLKFDYACMTFSKPRGGPVSYSANTGVVVIIIDIALTARVRTPPPVCKMYSSDAHTNVYKGSIAVWRGVGKSARGMCRGMFRSRADQ